MENCIYIFIFEEVVPIFNFLVQTVRKIAKMVSAANFKNLFITFMLNIN